MSIVCGTLNVWGRRDQATALFHQWKQGETDLVQNEIDNLPPPIKAEIHAALIAAREATPVYAA